MDAVIGVVGIALAPTLGGGVTVPLFFAAAVASCRAAIFEAVEVLNGRRFSGGSLSGCKVRLLAFLVSSDFFSVAGSVSAFVA